LSLEKIESHLKEMAYFWGLHLERLSPDARVVELVDTQDLKSCSLKSCTGSTPVPGTTFDFDDRNHPKLVPLSLF
ncbi:MAG: hypothetical protein RLZZ630_553, partial [Bacteroidota bacterium]